MYQFSVSEGAAVGTAVGRVIATDADMGENTDMTYLIKDGGELFKVTTDAETQEAVVSIKKVQFSKLNQLLELLSLPLMHSDEQLIMLIGPQYVNICERFQVGSISWFQQKLLATRKVGSTRGYKLEARAYLPII